MAGVFFFAAFLLLGIFVWEELPFVSAIHFGEGEKTSLDVFPS
jgi:hypothetical protein